MTTARQVALAVLAACRRQQAFVQEILNHQLSRAALGGAERRLATQLAYGVLRRRATIDAILRPFLSRPLGTGKEEVHDALRLGVYQLVWLTQVPVHAAVHETVNLVHNNLKGLANGVLRSVARHLTGEITDQPAADAVPLEDGRFRRLTKPMLPEPAAHPVEYLASAFAVPDWLAQRWLERFGWQECLRLGFWFAATPPLWLRCNLLRTDRSALLAALSTAGIQAVGGEHPQAIRLADHAAVRELPGYAEGWFAVQDASAMRVASALAPAPGSVVLDLCAAPGGKTTHLAELMHNEGRIVACDVEEHRLQTLRELAQRLGATIIEPCRIEEPPPGPFDAILVDAPCSNTGVLGRRPEIRWRLQAKELGYLANLQKRLLLQAAERLRRGGVMVYSTCSIEPEENQQVVQSVVQAMPELTLEHQEEQRPGVPADGGYWAKLRQG
jgi:16S rRNA (cytosine967-C5)-methyltransferase